MRVLLVHNRYRTAGGEERHIELLEQWLPQVGIDVRRLEVTTPRSLSWKTEAKLGLTLPYRLEGARILRAALLRHRPAIVHFHNIFPLLTPAAVREARMQGAGVVLTVHNYRFACPSGTLLRGNQIHEDCLEGSSLVCGLRNSRGRWPESVAYGFALEIQRRFKFLHRWVDAFVAPSHFVAAALERAGYPVSRVTTIYHGIPLVAVPPPVGGFGFFAGRLSREKGIVTLLKASARASDVPVVIAGAGPLTAAVRAAALSQSIAFHGRVDADAVAELRRRARFSLVPSEWYEVQPYAVLESMAMGRAVIASNLGSLPEIVHDDVNGVLTHPGDPTDLADAMMALWSDIKRARRLGEGAWLFAREHFAPRVHAQRVANLYRKLGDEL